MTQDLYDPGKRFRTGMYGGKFYPFHRGHAHCIDVASRECDVLYVVLFFSILDEYTASQTGLVVRYPAELRCSHYARADSILEYIASKDENIKLMMVNTNQFLKDGEEDWYSEAEHIKERIPRTIDAVYSSEPSYSDFFAEAYPQAVHRLIDPKRRTVPISGTEIRSMAPQEARKWIM